LTKECICKWLATWLIAMLEVVGMFLQCTNIVKMEFDANMHTKYEELASIAINHLENFAGSSVSSTRQLWIAIGGGPGSGKSTLTAEVVARINTRFGSEIAVMIGMDGFHFSRVQLREMSERGLYSWDDLIARRGSPWTFDAKVFIYFLWKRKMSILLNSFSILLKVVLCYL
jgi:pantothenate kinase